MIKWSLNLSHELPKNIMASLVQTLFFKKDCFLELEDYSSHSFY